MRRLKQFTTFFTCASITAFAGCTSSQPTPSASELGLDQVFRQIRDGLNAFRPQDPNEAVGYLASDLSVTVAFTAKQTDSKKLVLNLTPAPVIREIPSGSFETSRGFEASQANTITILFKNPYTISKDTTIGAIAAAIATNGCTVTVKRGGTEQTIKGPVDIMYIKTIVDMSGIRPGRSLPKEGSTPSVLDTYFLSKKGTIPLSPELAQALKVPADSGKKAVDTSAAC